MADGKTMLPCPFCGGKEDTRKNPTGQPDLMMWEVGTLDYQVLCLNCESRGPQKPDETSAADSWNERPDEA